MENNHHFKQDVKSGSDGGSYATGDVLDLEEFEDTSYLNGAKDWLTSNNEVFQSSEEDAQLAVSSNSKKVGKLR